MPRYKIRLSDISTCSELANEICVDAKALELVKLSTSTTCSSDDCNLPAVQKNNGRCLLCSQSWYPREFNSNGHRMKNCRGHGLFGPQYMWDYKKKKPTSCCCDTPLCEKNWV